jgi:hypothetical protein
MCAAPGRRGQPRNRGPRPGPPGPPLRAVAFAGGPSERVAEEEEERRRPLLQQGPPSAPGACLTERLRVASIDGPHAGCQMLLSSTMHRPCVCEMGFGQEKIPAQPSEHVPPAQQALCDSGSSDGVRVIGQGAWGPASRARGCPGFGRRPGPVRRPARRAVGNRRRDGLRGTCFFTCRYAGAACARDRLSNQPSTDAAGGRRELTAGQTVPPDLPNLCRGLMVPAAPTAGSTSGAPQKARAHVRA